MAVGVHERLIHKTNSIRPLYTCPQEMLYRRLQKLQVQLTCTQRLDKAKPEKKEAVGSTQ